MQRSEVRVVVWGAATFACLLAATFVIRPVRDALVLDGKPELIPALFSASFAAMLVLAPAWGWVIGRVPRKRFVAAGYHVVAACLLGFIALINTAVDPIIVGRVFYVWSAVANLFVVSVFWSVCADVLGPDTARRLYGPIAVGGTVGALVGPALAKALIAWHGGIVGVLIAGAVLVELAVIGVGQLERAGAALADTNDARAEQPVPGRAIDGLRDLARSPYLAGIGLYALLTACAATFVYLEQAGIVKAAFATPAARTDFFATVDLFTNLGVLVIQGVVIGPLLGWVGVGVALAVLPVLQGGGMIALIAAPSLTTLVIVQVATRAAQHGVIRPGRELLFTVVPRDEKYRAKNVIDTLIYRSGDVGSAWLHLGLVGASIGGGALLAVSLPITALWIGTAVALGFGFRRRKKLAARPSS